MRTREIVTNQGMREGEKRLPGYADFELVLHRDEVGEYSQRRGRCHNHDQQPEVELCFRPMISPPSLYDTDLVRHFEKWRKCAR